MSKWSARIASGPPTSLNFRSDPGPELSGRSYAAAMILRSVQLKKRTVCAGPNCADAEDLFGALSFTDATSNVSLWGCADCAETVLAPSARTISIEISPQ